MKTYMLTVVVVDDDGDDGDFCSRLHSSVILMKQKSYFHKGTIRIFSSIVIIKLWMV